MGFKIAKWIVDAVTILSLVFLVAMLVLVCANVILRYVFSAPIVGATEITQMLMICLTTTMAGTLFRGQHVWIDLVTQKFKRIPSIILDLVTLLASAGIFGILSWRLFAGMQNAIAKAKVYSMLKIPQWPFYLVFCLALAALTLATLVYLIDRMCVYARHETPGAAVSFMHVVSEEEKIAELYDEKGGDDK